MSEELTLQPQNDAEDLVGRLRQALGRDGDFPASAKVVSELRRLVGDPKTTSEQIAEVILKEPSLGTRVLHLVNSSFYRRVKPIMTVSQAVTQVGMKPLAELCSGLVLLQRFVPMARRGGPFATSLQKTIVTSLLSSSLMRIVAQTTPTKSDETGYLAGSFSQLGPLLLAYYFPQLYESAAARAQAKGTTVEQGIHEITGLTATDLSMEVVSSLDLPEFYKQVLTASRAIAENPQTVLQQPTEIQKAAKVVTASQEVAEVVVSGGDKSQLDRILRSVGALLHTEVKSLATVLGDLPGAFGSHCTSMELDLPTLPDFLLSYSTATPDAQTAATKGGPQNKFSHYVEEIREAVESHEPPASVITSVMETLAWGLSFDRVLLLLVSPNRTKLIGRMLLGKINDLFDPKSFERPLVGNVSPYAPDARAFSESRPIFVGDALFDNAWPIAALPIGYGNRCIGIIYADRISKREIDLDNREQAAMILLSELLDKSVSSH